MISLRQWCPGPKSGPGIGPFGGAQVLEKAMNSKGFEAFWPLRGVHFGSILGLPDFGTFQDSEESVKAK